MKRALSVLVLLLLVSAMAAAQEVTEEQAGKAFLRAQQDVAEMAEMGLGITYVNDSLNEARRAFEGVNYTRLLEEAEGIEDEQTRQYTIAQLIEAQKLAGGAEVSGQNYALVVQKAEEIAGRKERAYLLSDSLRALELRIEEMRSRNLETGEAESLLKRAHGAFEKENYGEAEDLVFQANSYLSEVDAEATLVRVRYNTARENAVAYLNRHRQDLLIAGIAIIVVAFVVYSRVNKVLVKRRLKDLRFEKEVLGALIKKAQIDHFKKGLITRDTYDIKLAKYKERILEIERTIPVLESRVGIVGKEKKDEEIEVSPEDIPAVKLEAPPPKPKPEKDRIKRLEDELKQKEEELREAKEGSAGYGEARRLQEELGALKRTLEEREAALAKSEEEASSLRAKVGELEEKLGAGAPEGKESAEIEKLRGEFAEKQKEAEAGKKELEAARVRISELEGRIKELEGELEAAGESGAEKAKLQEAESPRRKPSEDLEKRLKLAETEREVVLSLLQKLTNMREKVDGENYRTREEQYRERLNELEKEIKALKLEKVMGESEG